MFSGGEKNSFSAYPVIGNSIIATLTEKNAILLVPIISYAFSK